MSVTFSCEFYTIYMWPDGVWCYEDELPEMTHKSDDFTMIKIPLRAPEGILDDLVIHMNKHGHLENYRYAPTIN